MRLLIDYLGCAQEKNEAEFFGKKKFRFRISSQAAEVKNIDKLLHNFFFLTIKSKKRVVLLDLSQNQSAWKLEKSIAHSDA